MTRYWREEIERLPRDDLTGLVDERVRATVAYAAEHSPFYRQWFREHHVRPEDVRTHEDLLSLPLISGSTVREHQPPVAEEFAFRSVPWEEVYTIHETSGTSGTPKTFFLTWEDWQRYAEKYARIFTAQGFGRGDRVAVCASYGMNVGANTMTLAARDLEMTIIPEGRCTFPLRVITSYRPTGIVASVFKLLRLARVAGREGHDPRELGLEALVVGGEAFAPEALQHVEELWGCPVYNTYGSTEGAMCGECTARAGLHVPEDLVHTDLYDPGRGGFVPDGEWGRLVITTLIPPGGRAGTLLINYDTGDLTRVRSREECDCGRTHLRVDTPIRSQETVYIAGVPVNRVDIESAVFQPEHMAHITGEYEAFLYEGGRPGTVVLRVSLESRQEDGRVPRELEPSLREALIRRVPPLESLIADDILRVLLHTTGPGGLELHRVPGRPKRIVDRR